MESEVELDEELKRMHLLAAAPELYADFVSLGALPSLLGLLAHENADIVIEVIGLLAELTDSETGASNEQMGTLVAALVSALRSLATHMNCLS